MPNVRPCEVLFVTSRSLAVDQQAAQYESLVRLVPNDDVPSFWRDGSDIEDFNSIRITTYDKLETIMFGSSNHSLDCHSLDHIKVVIFDEIHSVFCDTFISYMKVLQLWLSEEVPKGERYFFGLTATPGILYECAPVAGIELNVVNEPMYKYKAKKVQCVDTDELVRLLRKELKGKTVVMCRHSRTCYWLQKQVPKSVVLTSKNGDDYITCNMSDVRRSIVYNFSLPKDVTILIATETIREGFTFIEDSGIRNIVSFFPDEMNIHQLVGRCRFDVDNLIIVNTKTRSSHEGYLGKQRELFESFCKDRKNTEWFECIKDITDGNVDNVRVLVNNIGNGYHKSRKPQEANPSIAKFKKKSSVDTLMRYIDKNWCDDTKVIYSKETKEKILEDINTMKVFTEESNVDSWIKLERVLTDIGYEVVNTRQRVNGQRVRCKTIRREVDE